MTPTNRYRYFYIKMSVDLNLTGNAWRVDSQGTVNWSNGSVWLPINDLCVYKTLEDLEAAVSRGILVEVSQ